MSPSKLFQQRKLRTRFDLMKPDLKGYVTLKQAQQKQYHDKHAKSRFFFPGTPVMVRNFQEPNKWIPGIILKKLGPVTYQVEIANGRILKRHIEHLILRRESSSVSTAPDTTQLDSAVRDIYHYPQDETTPAQLDQWEPEQPVVCRYLQRHRHPPECLMVVTTCLTFYLDRGENVVSAISLLELLVLVVNILCKVMCYLFSLLFLYTCLVLSVCICF